MSTLNDEGRAAIAKIAERFQVSETEVVETVMAEVAKRDQNIPHQNVLGRSPFSRAQVSIL